MRSRLSVYIVLILTACFAIVCSAVEPSEPNQSSKYLDAVREFADNVLKYGRDTYGPKHTPLFVDGLNIHTHEPVKWISTKGDYSTATDTEEWILSNFASQQTLMRTLDGLSELTGDRKYREAAMETIEYAFEHLQVPNGLLYWGQHTAYDALYDHVRTHRDHHIFKLHYPYYELMWKVNPNATKKFIEAFWSAHILDWSNLDMNRISRISETLEEPWNHEYKGGPTFFKSKFGGRGFVCTGGSLVHAGTTLYKFSNQQQPLLWSKRLVKRFVDTRHPKTGISAHIYNNSWLQLGDDLKEHFVDPYTTIFPFNPFEFRNLQYPQDTGAVLEAFPWMSIFLVGEMLGEEGKEFTRWALEEFTAWGKVSYRRKDNSFVPMLTDGTNLEGYVWKERPSGLNVAKPYPADPSFFWAYSVAYCTTGDEFMWEMLRDIALGNNFGDIGETPVHTTKLLNDTACSRVYGLLGFLQLYAKTKKPGYIEMARRIGDNILNTQLHKGFFVPSKRHIYTRFDCFEPLALLHLDAAIKSDIGSVPCVWPNVPLFVPPYRHKLEEGIDRLVIYALTESPELPFSLQEAAAIGDVDLVRTLIEKGADVDSVDNSLFTTALECAVMGGHKEVVALLIAKGAKIDGWNRSPSKTVLHYAAEDGYREIAEMLIASGADINAKDNRGQTPLDIAIRWNRKDIVELLTTKVDKASSIHIAVQLGALTGVKTFLEEGVDINLKDDRGYTPLHYAVEQGHKDIVEFLIAKGADIDSKNKIGHTPLCMAVRRQNKDLVRLLVDKGADVNPEIRGFTLLNFAVSFGDKDTVEILIDHGTKFDVEDQAGWTAFRYAASQGRRDIVELFISRGADTSSFHMAACAGDLIRVKHLVEQGTDVDVKDKHGWTPLHWAACTGRTEVAEFIIAKGADIHTKTEDGTTVIHQAVQVGELDLIKLLISKGGDVNAANNRGITPLHIAARAGNINVAELLIANVGSIDPKDRLGLTPLYYAAIAGRKDIVALLIAKGADVNCSDRNGQTFLHLSVRQGRRNIVELLIDKGADVNARNKRNRTPLDIAIAQGFNEIAELLRKHGAKE